MTPRPPFRTLCCALILAGLLGSWLTTGPSPLRAAAPAVPIRLGPWVGQPVELAGPASAQRRALIAREYRTPGHPAVYFLLMPYDEQRFTHGPEVCYEGLGWRLHREVDLRLPAGHRLNRLVGEDDRGDRLLIAYGVTLGAALHPDGLALKLRTVAARLARQPDVRQVLEVTTRVPIGQEAAGQAALNTFLGDIATWLTTQEAS